MLTAYCTQLSGKLGSADSFDFVGMDLQPKAMCSGTLQISAALLHIEYGILCEHVTEFR